MVLTANYQGMARAAFVIKNRKHIDYYLEMILVQMDIFWRDWLIDSVEMVALKHSVVVNSSSKAMLFWEIGLFEEVQ